MRFIERYAWTVFAALSVVIIVFGVGDVLGGGATYGEGEAVLFKSLTGTTWDGLRSADPGAVRLIDQQVRSGGAALLVLGLMSLAICGTALRGGERWAWFAMWAWPLLIMLIYFVFWTAQPDLQAGIPVPLVSGAIFLLITVPTLLLSYRRYLKGAVQR